MKITVQDMLVNGVEKPLDPVKRVIPVVSYNVLFIPIIPVITEMGITGTYDAVTKKITVDYKGTKLELWIGKTTAKVNGVDKTIAEASFMGASGKPLVSLNTVAGFVSCYVEWNPKDKSALIWYTTGRSGLVNSNSELSRLILGKPTVIIKPDLEKPPVIGNTDFTEDQLEQAALAWVGTWNTDQGTLILSIH